jgi:hypothetical protein
MKAGTAHRVFAAVVTLALTACAGNTEQESVVARNDAIDDYVKVAELKEVDQIRIRRQLHHKVITEHYIIIYDDRVPYLATFQRRCRELNEPDVKPDVRHESRKLRARFDTYRGCKIRSLHEVTSGQAEELLDLGTRTIN